MIFFYHYNKPASKAAGEPILTLHYKKQCHPVKSIICGTETWTHKQKRQPHIVVKGNAKHIDIVCDVAYIY